MKSLREMIEEADLDNVSEEAVERLADDIDDDDLKFLRRRSEEQTKMLELIISQVDWQEEFYRETQKNLLDMQAHTNGWMKEITKSLLILFILMVVLIVMAFTAPPAQAETTVTPFLSMGAYHKICATSSSMHCADWVGSDTPGTIDLGFRIEPSEPKWYLLYSDEIDILIHHQSYVDRGWIIPNVIDLGGTEEYIDMIGARFTWTFESLRFSF